MNSECFASKSIGDGSGYSSFEFIDNNVLRMLQVLNVTVLYILFNRH